MRIKRCVAHLLLSLSLLLSAQLGLTNDINWAVSTLAPNMDNFCEKRREVEVVDPKRLLLWLLDLVGISDTAMDLNGDGDTLYVEKVALISDETAFSQCVELGRCDTLDQNKINKVKDIISSLWAPVEINPFKTQFLPGREGSNSEITLASFLNPEVGLETICPVRTSTIIEGDAFSEELDKKLTEKQAEKKKNWYDNVLLREASEDITKPFSEAAPANLTLEGNRLNNTREIEAEFTLAYLLSEQVYEKRFSQYYLYTQFDSDVVSIDGEETTSSRNAISLGMIAEYKLGKFDNVALANNIISFRPSYTSDLIQHSRTANFTSTWAPIPDLGEENFVLNLIPITSHLNFKLNGDFRLESGRVFEDGKGEVFDGNTTYVDMGYNFVMLFTGAKNSVLERFQWDTHYKKLYATINDQLNKEYINSTLRYYVNQNFNIGLEYEKGRKGVQFNSVDTWEVSFGAKY